MHVPGGYDRRAVQGGFLYEPAYDRAIAWNDPEIAIVWPEIDVIVSPKDRDAPQLKDSDVNFVYNEGKL